MRSLKRNKVKFYYALYRGVVSRLDEYGNETLEQNETYYAPVEAEGHISIPTGFKNSNVFGNIEDYDKVIIIDDINCPIDEQTVLCIDTQPSFDEEDHLIYDYIVRRVSKSFNSISVYVSKVVEQKTVEIIPEVARIESIDENDVAKINWLSLQTSDGEDIVTDLNQLIEPITYADLSDLV